MFQSTGKRNFENRKKRCVFVINDPNQRIKKVKERKNYFDYLKIIDIKKQLKSLLKRFRNAEEQHGYHKEKINYFVRSEFI